MKVLIVGPYTSPIISRLKYYLDGRGIEVKVASFGSSIGEGDYSLGKLKGFKSYFNFFKLNKVIKTYKPDVVHAHIVNHYGLMSLLSTKPIILAAWGSDVLLANKSGNVIKDLFFTLINKLVLNRVAHIHTSGTSVYRSLIDEYNCDSRKVSVFYWGLPLIASGLEIDSQRRLETEFGLKGDRFIVFNRGLGSVYNPGLVLKIIKDINVLNIQRKIVVFKGFAGVDEFEGFKELLPANVILIDRLLTDDELISIYKRTDVHVSVPVSDSLGGGVVEPALLGSFPILSDLQSYSDYIKENPGAIISDDSYSDIIGKISSGVYRNTIKNMPIDGYKAKSIVSELLEAYEELVRKC